MGTLSDLGNNETEGVSLNNSVNDKSNPESSVNDGDEISEGSMNSGEISLDSMDDGSKPGMIISKSLNQAADNLIGFMMPLNQFICTN